MKPSEKQIKAINTVLSIIKTLKNTNDITIPTHHSDCYDFLSSDLMDDLDYEVIDEIHNKTMDLWFLINNIKDLYFMKKICNELIDNLNKLEDKLYSGDIHQVTIDLVQNSIDDLMIWSEYNIVPFDSLVGSLEYQADCVLEVCDKTLKDYNIISELVEILSKYH